MTRGGVADQAQIGGLIAAVHRDWRLVEKGRVTDGCL
jgi:hypothetical protein